MSERDHDELDREDLVARARRGLLSPGEHATLARALDRDPELRAAYRVGLALDRAGAVQGGDDALIASAADAALARAAEMTSRTRAAHASAQTGEANRSRAAGAMRFAVAASVAVSVIFASGIATALFTGELPWPFRGAASPPSEHASASAVAPKPKRERQQPSRAQHAPSQERAEPPLLAPVEEKLAHNPRATAAERAAGLFHEANAARRDGDLRRARRLYAQLIATHPGSDEAGLARVSLGSLLLAAGDARGAEREFRAYLAAGSGQLREEALVGQAQSLSRLGRADEERVAWRRLLEAHPSSVYAAQARLRLDALEGAQDEGTH